METYQEKPKKLPIIGRYDVIVIGGGCAGFSAAVAAARNGAKTLIIERFPFFGGTATASLMANIVGTRNQVPPNNLQVLKGIGEELILKLIAADGAEVTHNAYPSNQRSNTKGDLSYSYAFDTELFKKITLEMILDARCEILFHTWFADVIMEGNHLRGIIFENKSGRQAAYAKVIIDASGDGDVATRAGVPFWQTKASEKIRLNDCMMYRVAGYDLDTPIEGCGFKNTMVLWGPNPGLHNAVDARELTEMEINTRLTVFDHLETIKKRVPGMAKARIVETGALLGIRQTRFIEGVYQITGDDVLSGAHFVDAIAMGANPVISYFGYRRFLEHEGYEIPYRCLLPRKVDGLIIAGRCISSDQVAFESWRAMSHILAIGEGAGTAAAISVSDQVSPRQVDIAKVRSQLIAQGAEIGQGRTNQS